MEKIKCKIVMLTRQDNYGYSTGDLIQCCNTKFDSQYPLNYIMIAPQDRSKMGAVEGWDRKHLYLVTDELPVQINDHIYITGAYDKISICTGIYGETLLDGCSNRKMIKHCPKVVACTDAIGIPAIPQSVIDQYVNSQGKDDEVWIEINEVKRIESLDNYDDDIILVNGEQV